VTAVRRAFGHAPLVVGPGIKTGVSVLYENPREIGADRIVNAVAAYEQFKEGVIVVDFGTATTFDCVSPKGEYLGGVIVPGITVSLDALLARAAKLSRVEITEPPKVVGRNTAHAIQSGVVHGYSSLVDGLVEKLRTELEFPCRVIATGGLAPLIARQTRTIENRGSGPHPDRSSHPVRTQRGTTALRRLAPAFTFQRGRHLRPTRHGASGVGPANRQGLGAAGGTKAKGRRSELFGRGWCPCGERWLTLQAHQVLARPHACRQSHPSRSKHSL